MLLVQPCLTGIGFHSYDSIGKAQHYMQWIGVSNEQLQAVLEKYQEVFKDKLSTVRDLKASITLKEGSQPTFFRPRSVSFAIKEAVGAEID